MSSYASWRGVLPARAMRALVLALMAPLAAFGCSANHDSPESDETFSCDPWDSEGTFLVHFEGRDGNCTTPSDYIFSGGLADPSGGDCTDAFPPRVTDQGCRIETSSTCARSDGGAASIDAVLRQQDEAGDRFEGIAAVTVYRPDGSFECRSTYDVSATRQ